MNRSINHILEGQKATSRPDLRRLVTALFIAAFFINSALALEPRPAFVYPASGTMLANSSTLNFEWTDGGRQDIIQYWVRGARDAGFQTVFYDSGYISSSSRSHTVNNIPINDGAIYLKLFFQVSSGTWYSTSFPYLSFSASPQLVTPAEGSVLPASSAKFTWTPGPAQGVTGYWIWAGDSLDNPNYFSSGLYSENTRSMTVTGLPNNGSTVYIRLWYRYGAQWQYTSYIYTSASSTPSITNLTDHATLAPNQYIAWNRGSLSPSSYFIWAGTNPGFDDILSSGVLSSSTLSFTFPSDLPKDGRLIYLRYWYQTGGLWMYRDSVACSLASTPELTTPAEGSRMTKNAQVSTNPQPYEWRTSPHFGGVLSWILYIGSTPGNFDYYHSPQALSANTSTISIDSSPPLPQNGQTLHNRLWGQLWSGQWTYVDTTSRAPLVSPGDIDGDGVRNQWDWDMDGDGIPNELDPDADGDGELNFLDIDADNGGDGNAPNDPTPLGPTMETHRPVLITYSATGGGLFSPILLEVRNSNDTLVWSDFGSSEESFATLMLKPGEGYIAHMHLGHSSSGKITFSLNENDPWIPVHTDYTQNPPTRIVTPTLEKVTEGQSAEPTLDLLPVEVKDVSNNQVITDTAWIKGHRTDGSSEEPEWPKLEARISGLPADMQVEWKLENRYPRRNGRDDLNIPGVDGAEPGIFTTGSEAWKIWETVQNTSTPYFGGDVKVKFQLHGGSGGSGTWNEVSFKVRGENPDDARCKAHIIANQGSIWYAWAIAKHESGDSKGDYNQFANGLDNGGAGAHGAKGEPFYAPSEGDGWGLFQRDSASGIPVTTKETWSWDGNMRGFINDEYPEQLRIANNYVDSVKRNNPNTFVEPQFTIKGQAISGRHVLEFR